MGSACDGLMVKAALGNSFFLYANQPRSYNLANWAGLKSLREAIYIASGEPQADIKNHQWE